MCFACVGYHQIQVSIREGSSLENFVAEIKLRCIEWEWVGYPAAMKIVTEIIWVVSFVCLDIVIKDNNPYVPAVADKWLKNKGVREDIVGSLGVHIFDVTKEVDTKTGIFPIVFEYNFFNIMVTVEGNGVEESMDVVDDDSVWDHERTKQAGLECLGTTGKLGSGRGDEVYASFHKVEQEMLFLVFQA